MKVDNQMNKRRIVVKIEIQFISKYNQYILAQSSAIIAGATIYVILLI